MNKATNFKLALQRLHLKVWLTYWTCPQDSIPRITSSSLLGRRLNPRPFYVDRDTTSVRKKGGGTTPTLTEKL